MQWVREQQPPAWLAESAGGLERIKHSVTQCSGGAVEAAAAAVQHVRASLAGSPDRPSRADSLLSDMANAEVAKLSEEVAKLQADLAKAQERQVAYASALKWAAAADQAPCASETVCAPASIGRRPSCRFNALMRLKASVEPPKSSAQRAAARSTASQSTPACTTSASAGRSVSFSEGSSVGFCAAAFCFSWRAGWAGVEPRAWSGPDCGARLMRR